MWKNWLSYLASGTTLAVLIFMTGSGVANAETIVPTVADSGTVDRVTVSLNVTSHSLQYYTGGGQRILNDLGCTCAACQKVSTQTPL